MKLLDFIISKVDCSRALSYVNIAEETVQITCSSLSSPSELRIQKLTDTKVSYGIMSYNSKRVKQHLYYIPTCALHPHCAEKKWKRRFHSKSASILRRRNLKTQQSPLILENTWSSWRHRFKKAPLSKCFPSTRKHKAGVFKLLRFEKRFRKAPFLAVDGRPNRRNKSAFSNVSGVVSDQGTLPEADYSY